MDARTITIIIEIALLAFCLYQLVAEVYEMFTGETLWSKIARRR